jgi:hypothetical protein
LNNLGRKLLRRELVGRGKPALGDGHVDLRRSALGTEGPPVFDRRPALLARVFHFLKLAHNEPEEQGRRHRRIGPSWDRKPRAFCITRSPDGFSQNGVTGPCALTVG